MLIVTPSKLGYSSKFNRIFEDQVHGCTPSFKYTLPRVLTLEFFDFQITFFEHTVMSNPPTNYNLSPQLLDVRAIPHLIFFPNTGAFFRFKWHLDPLDYSNLFCY